MEVKPSRGITLTSPLEGSVIKTRAIEVNGSISVNGFMQQFAVQGVTGTYAEKAVVRPGENHIAVQIGELYACDDEPLTRTGS